MWSDPISLIVYTAAFLFFVFIFTIEVIAPASGNTCDKRWRIYAGALNSAQLVMAITVGVLFRNFFHEHALTPLPDALPWPAKILVTFLVASFFAYWWHRLEHKSDFLWRVFHQLHHAPSRVEALTSFYVHPFDGLAAIMLNCAIAYGLFGVGPEVAAGAIVIAAIYNIYIHSDTKSPNWIAHFVQRPEMHRIHHKKDHHADNYGLPIWDLMFGTFNNNSHEDFTCGFSNDAQEKIKDMLLLKNVS